MFSYAIAKSETVPWPTSKGGFPNAAVLKGISAFDYKSARGNLEYLDTRDVELVWAGPTYIVSI